MKAYFSEIQEKYDGSQLRCLFAYLSFGVPGDSVVSWVGPCHIPFANMVDGEDVSAKSEIRSDNMVHFIVEKFDIDLFAGVALQRLMASLAIDLLKEISPNMDIRASLRRDGDDVYYQSKKLSISVATKSPTSTLIHFAVNVTNEGTPVPTLSLQDLKVEPAVFAKELMKRLAFESESIVIATRKVFPVWPTK